LYSRLARYSQPQPIIDPIVNQIRDGEQQKYVVALHDRQTEDDVTKEDRPKVENKEKLRYYTFWIWEITVVSKTTQYLLEFWVIAHSTSFLCVIIIYFYKSIGF
jgi:hypothetical protein